MKIKLFPKFLIVISLVALIPIVLLGNRLITMGQLGVKTAILELHLSTADKISQRFESFISDFDKKALFIMSAMKQMDWENKQILLSSFVKSSAEVKQISIISNKGSELIKVVGVGGKNKRQLSNYAKDRSLLKAVQNKKRVLKLHCSEDSKDIAFYYPAFGKFVIRILANMEQVSREVEDIKVGKTGFAIVADSSGHPILYPEDIQLDKAALKKVKSWPIVEQALKSLALGSMEYEDSKGNAFIGSYSPLQAIGGAVIIRQSKKEAYNYALFMKKEALYLILVFVIIVFLVSYLMSRQLVRPIMHITKTAEYVAAGNFNHKVLINSRDELMDLAKTFNRMISELKKYSDLQVDKIIKEQTKIEAILFSIEDGILMTDYDGNVQLANRKARSV
ncbi:MAG: HAMP domain-containing protein, partial [Elusimicrobiota bacterium]|nr:HAMP domain-containing protein [Elusimicrobiota bacterium]